MYLLFGIKHDLKHFVTIYESNMNPHRLLNAINNDFFSFMSSLIWVCIDCPTSLSETLGSIRSSCRLGIQTCIFESATAICIGNCFQNMVTIILETKLELGSFWYQVHK